MKKEKNPADKDSSKEQKNAPIITTKETKNYIIVNIKFRPDKNGGHNHVIVDDYEENHVSVGLTTKSKKGKNHPNIPLKTSPFSDGKKSYIRRQGTVAPKKSYTSPRKGKMTPEDYNKAKAIGAKAKQKHIEKKRKKK